MYAICAMLRRSKIATQNLERAYFPREQIGKEGAYVYLHYPPDPRVEALQSQPE